MYRFNLQGHAPICHFKLLIPKTSCLTTFMAGLSLDGWSVQVLTRPVWRLLSTLKITLNAEITFCCVLLSPLFQLHLKTEPSHLAC